MKFFPKWLDKESLAAYILLRGRSRRGKSNRSYEVKVEMSYKNGWDRGINKAWTPIGFFDQFGQTRKEQRAQERGYEAGLRYRLAEERRNEQRAKNRRNR